MRKGKLVAVVGATGAQGSSLARAILSDPVDAFRVRAITRDPSSAAARDLAKQGAEVVAADLDDPGSVARAFEGAHAAFCVTFYWAHYSPEKEVAHAKTMAEAAKQAGVQHVVWSTLDDTRQWVPLSDSRMPTLMGRYKVPHFDGKADADHVFTDLGLPVTFLLTSFYWENMIHFGSGPKRSPDGTLTLTLPMGDKKLPGIAAEDIGRCAYGIFKRGASVVGRRIGIAGGFLTGAQMAESLSRALGQTVRYHPIEPDAYRALGFPGAEDLGNMFQVKRDFEAQYCGARSLSFSKELNPQLQTFDDWLIANARHIPTD